MNQWLLPESAVIGGIEYEINTDFRYVLEIVKYLNDPNEPDFVRWQIAIALFYEGEIPEEHHLEAMKYLSAFISYTEEEDSKPGQRLIDWEQDCKEIIADVNKVAGREIRALPYLHWWTFLSYFQAIGEGQLSTLVSIRNKLAKGRKLDDWEKEFYRDNKSRVDLKKVYSAADLAEQDRLKKLLGE